MIKAILVRKGSSFKKTMHQIGMAKRDPIIPNQNGRLAGKIPRLFSIWMPAKETSRTAQRK
jgi:hypothetical protein